MPYRPDNRDIFDKALDDDRVQDRREREITKLALLGGALGGAILGGAATRIGKRALKIPPGMGRAETIGSIIGGTAGTVAIANYAANKINPKRKARKKYLYDIANRRK